MSNGTMIIYRGPQPPSSLRRQYDLLGQQNRIKELADERDHDIGAIHKFVAKPIDESDRPAQSLQLISGLRNHGADKQPLALDWTGDSTASMSCETRSGVNDVASSFPDG
jgi:hypothetical protein